VLFRSKVLAFNILWEDKTYDGGDKYYILNYFLSDGRIEVKEDRDEYFRNKTNDQKASIENDLMKEEHPSMPISKDRQSRVEFGGRKKS
jgi:hypothetical protein